MVVVGWVLSALLAVAYLGAGGMKLASTKDKILENPRMGWAADFSPQALKGIGAVEVLGALGVILPWLTGVARWLTPVAAIGLVLVQIGAMSVHVRRGEKDALPVNISLVVLAAAVAVIRFSQL